MATTREDIGLWFDAGKKQKATHMIVVCDTFDWEDYPVYVTKDQDVKKIVQEHQPSAGNMQKVMEVYNLKLDKEQQFNAGRVFNY